MALKKPIIAVVLVIVILIVIITYILIGNYNNDSKAELNTEHSILYASGQNGFPKIDNGYIYWSIFDNNSIFRYDIESENILEYSPDSEPDYSLSNIFPSDGYIICEYFYELDLNFSIIYMIYNIKDNILEELLVDAWGIAFDYPYVVYHTIGIEHPSLFLLDLKTNTTEFINNASWGKISGDYIVYVLGLEAHIYHIPTKADTIIMKSEETNIDIEITKDKCLMTDTEDTGPGATTDIYIYQIGTGDLEKVGTYNNWIIYEEFDGRYLYWTNGGSDEEVTVMDTETQVTKTMASGQWIAPLAYGSLSAENNIVVWASYYEIHMGRIID
ncbi:MAG: hypothetical protein JSV09_07600 [Thermoplasmata archaeon]|nr:MAG: hypothetical protein JSV09_07600 [Thermoplasmata archaeon]